MEQTTVATGIPLAVVGGGNMAQAIVRGGIGAGVLVPSRVAVAEPDAEKRALWEFWGVRAVTRVEELGPWLEGVNRDGEAGQVLLAVKPQVFPEVAGAVGALARRRGCEAGGERDRETASQRDRGWEGRGVISVMAGVTIGRIREALGLPAGAPVARAMPNLAASVGRSVTAVAGDGKRGAGGEEGEGALAWRLFGAVGEVVAIEESMMNAFTAVAGSGPAYIFYLAEAMARAAEELGFDRATAERIVRGTVAGAAAVLEGSDLPGGAAALRSAVTSRGGTTAAATEVLERAGVAETFVHAIRAACDRGREMAEGR